MSNAGTPRPPVGNGRWQQFEGYIGSIRNLRANFDLATGLAGCASIDEIGSKSLAGAD